MWWKPYWYSIDVLMLLWYFRITWHLMQANPLVFTAARVCWTKVHSPRVLCSGHRYDLTIVIVLPSLQFIEKNANFAKKGLLFDFFNVLFYFVNLVVFFYIDDLCYLKSNIFVDFFSMFDIYNKRCFQFKSGFSNMKWDREDAFFNQ